MFVVLDVLVDAKPVCRDYEPHPCNCQPPSPASAAEPGCADLCLNRSHIHHYYSHCDSFSTVGHWAVLWSIHPSVCLSHGPSSAVVCADLSQQVSPLL